MTGLAHITIDGQPIELKFGMPALKRITEKMIEYGIGENEVLGDLGLAHVLYAGYQNACYMRDRQPAISFDKFYEYVEQGENPQEAAAAITALADSKYVKAEVDKKKATKTEGDGSIGTT